MISLITGGSGSGKSSYGEQLLMQFSGQKIYIATMEPFGEEARSAIERHRKMRKDKGFSTVEQYTDIGELSIPENCGILLECVGNLLANEMFGAQEAHPAEKILSGIRKLAEKAAVLVIISNDVGRDGIAYAPETMAYIQEIGKINAGIAEIADTVTECVFGIPLPLKGELPC